MLPKVVLASGLMFYLCGMFFLQQWAGYRSMSYVFLLLPAVIWSCSGRFYWARFSQNFEVRVFTGLLLLAGASLAWSGATASNELRYIFSIFLFVLSFIMIGQEEPLLLERCLKAAVVVSALSSLYTMVDFYLVQSSGSVRFSGEYGLLKHTILSAFVYGLFFIAAVYFCQHCSGSKWCLLLFAICALILFAYLLVAQSRGVLLAIITAIIFKGFMFSARFRWLFVVALTISLVGVYVVSEEYFLRRGWSYRPELWLAGFQLGLDNFWFGLGVGSEYRIVIPSGRSWDHPHSMFVKLFIDLGIVGLSLWLGLLAVLFVKLMRSQAKERILGAALMVYVLVATLFDGDGPFVRMREVWFVSWLPIALCLSWLLREQSLFSKERGD